MGSEQRMAAEVRMLVTGATDIGRLVKYFPYPPYSFHHLENSRKGVCRLLKELDQSHSFTAWSDCFLLTRYLVRSFLHTFPSQCLNPSRTLVFPVCSDASRQTMTRAVEVSAVFLLISLSLALLPLLDILSSLRSSYT